MSVKNLDIHPRYTSALLKARVFDVKKLLLYSKFELAKKTGLSENALAGIFSEAAKSIRMAPPTCVWDIMNKSSDLIYQHGRLTTGCPSIDSKFKGGIIFPGITEISGESASGKTQICIQLCLNVQKASGKGGMGGGALYICTEDAFPNKRLYQMAQEFSRKNPLFNNGKVKATDQIYIEHAADLEDLWSLLDNRIHVLLSQHNVKLIVIDSIAALFRAEYDIGEIQERAKMLAKFGRLLHDISYRNNMCVVCVNQVSDDVEGVAFDANDSDRSRNVIPALGLTWSYFVDTRLMLSRTQWRTSMFPSTCNKEQIVPSHDCVIRRLKVVYAPHLPPSRSYLIVDKSGIKDFSVPGQ